MKQALVLEAPISAKEDRDYLLEYKSINLGALDRHDVLDVPVDNLSRDEAVAVVLDLIEKKKGPYHVLFVDPLKLMRIRPGRKLSYIADQARLILPDGAGVCWAARRLGLPLKERIPMIAFIMDLIRVSVKKEFTIYLLGSRFEHLERVFINLQKSFPGVRIIGRQGGHFDAERETLIKESIRKSSPDVIFLGMGFPVQEEWMRENWQQLSRAVVIGVDGAFDVLSGKEKKAPDWAQVRGLAWFWRTITRPLYLDRVFLTLAFFLLTFFRSLRQKKKS